MLRCSDHDHQWKKQKQNNKNTNTSGCNLVCEQKLSRGTVDNGVQVVARPGKISSTASFCAAQPASATPRRIVLEIRAINRILFGCIVTATYSCGVSTRAVPNSEHLCTQQLGELLSVQESHAVLSLRTTMALEQLNAQPGRGFIRAHGFSRQSQPCSSLCL